jgi:predicted nucleic acid-binding protein
MNGVLLDTDVVSFLFKSHPLAARYDPELADRVVLVSFMTIAELDRWAIRSNWGEARVRRLQEFLEPFVVAPYNRELCRRWAQVTVTAERSGRRIECADAWIAASALLYRVPLVTHNRAHYAGIPGLTLISHAA